MVGHVLMGGSSTRATTLGQPARSSGADERRAADAKPRLGGLLTQDELDQLCAPWRDLGLVVDILDVYQGEVDAAEPSETVMVSCADHEIALVRVRGESPLAAASKRSLAVALEIACRHAYLQLTTQRRQVVAQSHYDDELSRRNQTLERAVAQLHELDRLKSNFLSNMSHELRTPLTCVIGYAEILIEGMAGPLQDEQHAHVQTILGKADHLLQLINGLLDLSTLNARVVSEPSARETTSALALLHSVINSFTGQTAARRIELWVADAAPANTDLGLAVIGDLRQLRQVIWHLLSNAIKFTADGGRIDISLQPSRLIPDDEHSPPAAKLIIRDSGIGMPSAMLPHVFEPFFQADSSSTRPYGGSGLGLTLAKAYVEAHGGRIWVDSTVGKGSIFTATLPAHDMVRGAR